MKLVFVDKEVYSYKKQPDKTYVALVGSSKAKKDLYPEVKEKFLNYLSENNIDVNDIVLVSGGAKGVDKFAEKLAEELDIDIVVIRPDYDEHYFKQAPLERNKRIAGLADIVVAFPKFGSSSGTLNTLKHARSFGKKTKVFYLKF